MKYLKHIYNILLYGYMAFIVVSLGLLFTNAMGYTNVSYWLLCSFVIIPAVIMLVVFLGGFSYYFSMDVYKRYNTMRAFKLGREIEKDQRNIQRMINTLKNSVGK